MSKTRGLSRRPKELAFDCLTELDFDTITVTASQANTIVQARFPLGLDFKISRVALVPGTGIANLTSFNIVMGEGAEAGLGPDDTFDTTGTWNFAAAGAQVFTVDRAVTNTAGLVQIYTPSNPEVIYPQGSELTLRIVSAAAAAGPLKAVMYGKFVHTKPNRPMSVPETLNLATDL